MTTGTEQSRRQERPPNEGPLADLQRRIDRARAVDPPARSRAATESGEHPLELLRRRIEAAHDPAAPSDSGYRQRAASAPPPLDALYDHIANAREALRSGAAPTPDPNRPAGDPLQVLRGRIQHEIDELGARSTIDLPRQPNRSQREELSSEAAPTSNVEARLGRELLEMLAERPLPGADRADAVSRLAAALEAPDRERLREVLRILVFPDD